MGIAVMIDGGGNPATPRTKSLSCPDQVGFLGVGWDWIILSLPPVDLPYNPAGLLGGIQAKGIEVKPSGNLIPDNCDLSQASTSLCVVFCLTLSRSALIPRTSGQ